MKLPNGERAIVDIQKLRGYCLNADYLRGRNKARVFAWCGIRVSDAEELRTPLLRAAKEGEAQLGRADSYGQRFIVDFDLVRPAKTVRIRSTWIILTAREVPRLTSCYVS